jgi:DNA transformation protein
MNDFVSYLNEVFELFGPITARKMFGGYGIYHQGLMFGLVTNDTLYLKADAENAGDFNKQRLGTFEYQKNGKVTQTPYYLAPTELMADRELAALWARRSYGAARRRAKTKNK